MLNIILTLLIVAMQGSCVAPDVFIINKYGGDKTIKIKMLNGNGKVVQNLDDSFVINPDALFSIKFIEQTQYQTTFDLEKLSGDSIIFYLYNTETDFKKYSFMQFILTNSGYAVKLNEQIIAQSDTIQIKQGKNYKIKIQSEGNLLNFSIDCADIRFQKIFLKATEYIMVRTDGNSRFKIKNLDFEKNFQ